MDAKVSREHAESVLAHVGAPKDRIQAILEDIDFPIDREELMNILQARGVTHDGLTNRMGGSP
jgi:hypothetical protein